MPLAARMRVLLVGLLLLAAPVLVAAPAQATSCVDDVGGAACYVIVRSFCTMEQVGERDPKGVLKDCP